MNGKVLERQENKQKIMKNHRMVMINNSLQQILSKILQQENPSKSLITVIEVKTAPDLHNAKVFLSIYGKGNHQDVLKKINARAPFIQYLVGQQIRLRRTPKFYFVIDNTISQADQIEQLLNKIKIKEKE